jgi:hypothetical protein
VAGEPDFDRYIQTSLETFGIDADETERAVMKGVLELYEPRMQQLRDADLEDVEPEPRADLSQAPPG